MAKRPATITGDDYYRLQMQMCGDSNAMLKALGVRPAQAYRVMLHEPEVITRWWNGAFEQSETEQAAIDDACRVYAERRALPDLPLPLCARFALRLRLGSRIIRAISSRHRIQPKGWFPNKLRRMPVSELIEWVLIQGWHFYGEVFDEALLWADEIEHRPAPSIHLPNTKPPLDGSGFCE